MSSILCVIAMPWLFWSKHLPTALCLAILNVILDTQLRLAQVDYLESCQLLHCWFVNLFVSMSATTFHSVSVGKFYPFSYSWANAYMICWSSFRYVLKWNGIDIKYHILILNVLEVYQDGVQRLIPLNNGYLNSTLSGQKSMLTTRNPRGLHKLCFIFNNIVTAEVA